MNSKSIISWCILLSLTACVSAYPTPQDKYVNDFAQILDANSVQTLHDVFQHVDQETTAEMVFVSLATLNGSDISQYATELGQSWGVGKADKDNGLVILYVQDANKIWVATGYSVEGILPDSKVGRLLDQYYVPARDSDQVAQGIVNVSLALAQVMLENKDELISNQAGPSQTESTFIILFIIVIAFLIISSIARRAGARWWWLPLFVPSRGPGGGGGFGGGGFGGGGFGGGGAGR